MPFTTLIAAALFLVQGARGSIEGTVISNATNKAIAGAQVTAVRFSGPAGPPGTPTRGLITGVLGGAPGGVVFAGTGTIGVLGGTSRPGQIPPVTTDANGHFVLADLEQGTYSIRAVADGYAQQDVQQVGPAGMTVNLASGQIMRDVVFRLVPGGAVSGRVIGSTGEPLANLEVSLFRSTYNPDGRKNMSSVTTAQTNDRGEYRLFWVTPGKYYLSVASSNRPMPGSVFRPEAANRYPRVFYPATSDPSAATPIVVQSAGELSGMDFRLTESPRFRIRGRLIDPSSDGNTSRGVSIGITPREGLVTGSSSSSAPYNAADGTFEIREVPSGSYFVRAQISSNVRPQPGQPFPQPATAVALVDVRGSDVDGVVLTVAPPISISGRVRFEGASSPVNLSGISVMLRTPSGMVFGGGAVPGAAQVGADGSFTITGIGPGDYLFQLLSQSALYVQSAMIGGADIVAHPLAVTTFVPGTIDVVLAATGGRLTGTVRATQSGPYSMQVVLIPDQRERYDLYRMVRTDSSGHFIFPALAPGAYKVFAFENMEPYSWFDPNALKPFEAGGTSVTVGNADLTLDLKPLAP